MIGKGAIRSDAIREYSRKYYLAHKEKALASSKKSYEKRKEEIRIYKKKWCREHKKEKQAYNRKWYEENKEKSLGYRRKYRKSNIEAVKLSKREHRIREREGGKLSKGIVVKLLSFQKHRCVVCRVSLKKSGYHVDHIIPLSKGGKNTDRNIQLTCPACNIKKKAKDPIIFMQEYGYLL